MSSFKLQRCLLMLYMLLKTNLLMAEHLRYINYICTQHIIFNSDFNSTCSPMIAILQCTLWIRPSYKECMNMLGHMIIVFQLKGNGTMTLPMKIWIIVVPSTPNHQVKSIKYMKILKLKCFILRISGIYLHWFNIYIAVVICTY